MIAVVVDDVCSRCCTGDNSDLISFNLTVTSELIVNGGIGWLVGCCDCFYRLATDLVHNMIKVYR